MSLEDVPLAEKYLSPGVADDEAGLYPLELWICQACGHVQLLNIVDPALLWAGYTYESGNAKGMAAHFEQVTNDILARHQPESGSLVVDVGSNDGSFLRCFQTRGFRVLGVDPATEIVRRANQAGVPTVEGFFTPSVAAHLRGLHGQAEIVTAFNAFAHTDDLHGMTEAIRTMLAPSGLFVFEAQYLVDVVDHGLLGTVFHEHLSHHSVKPLLAFLARHGLELIDVARVPIQGGSIIGYVQHRGAARVPAPSVAEFVKLEEAKRLDRIEGVLIFRDRLEAARARMQQLLAGWASEGKVVCGYGAARSGPTFINQLGLARSLQYILDDHPAKVGKLSPGHRIPVVPTSELAERKPDVAVILAWVHANRIIENNRAFLEGGGTFVVCSPDVEVVNRHSPPRPGPSNA